MEIQVLYEDEKILVINKPVGLVVNRAESIKGETVQDWVEKTQKIENPARSAYSTPASSVERSSSGWAIAGGSKTQDNELFVNRSGICHRLDKETSGCLLIAKNPTSLKYYLRKFEKREMTKKYLALVHGEVKPEQGSVVLPMRRSLFDREKWQVHYDGKKAVTFWNVLKRFSFEDSGEHWDKKLSLLELDLRTGRTHQIRVHLSFLGWPIFADERYLNKIQLSFDRKYLTHHFLHSRLLEFVDEEGRRLSVEAPLPHDCQILLDTMIE